MLSTIKRAKPKREDIFRITDEKKPSIAQFFIYLAGVGRLELTTCGFGDRRSTNWSYTPVDETYYA